MNVSNKSSVLPSVSIGYLPPGCAPLLHGKKFPLIREEESRKEGRGTTDAVSSSSSSLLIQASPPQLCDKRARNE